MAVALVRTALTYAGLVAGVAWLVAYRPQFALYSIIVAVALAASFVTHYRLATSSILRAIGARVVAAEKHPAVPARLERLAALTEIPAPRLAVAETSVVVVTRGLLETLEPEELEAELAHEIAHLAHRDAAVVVR